MPPPPPRPVEVKGPTKQRGIYSELVAFPNEVSVA